MLHLMQDQATPDGGWDFQFTWENSFIMYANLVSLVFAILLLVRLNGRRGLEPVATAGWWAALVLTAGTGLHFLGDITNFPEAWDHNLIHGVVATAAVVFFFTAGKE